MKIYDASGFSAKLTGSFTGSFTGDGSNLTGLVTYTKSEISGSFTTTSASFASTISSIIDGTTPVYSASRATTASYALNAGAGAGFPYSGSAEITGSLFVSGGNISGSFVGDGSGLTNVNIVQSTITSASFIGVTEYTASHTFNTKQVLVNTYLNDDTQFFPQEIKILDDSKVALKFNTPTTGRVVIGKAGHIISGSFVAEQATIVDTFTNVTSKNVYHKFNTKNVIVQVYEGDNVINPVSITTTNNDNVNVTFSTPRSGRIVVAKGGHVVTGTTITEETTVVDEFVNQSTVTTVHNFGTKNVFVQVYLNDDTQIIPASLTTVDNNTVVVTLDQARSGRVIVGKAGHIISGSAIADTINYTNIFNKPTIVSSSSQIDLAQTTGIAASSSYSTTAVTSSYANSISTTITGSLTTKVDNQNANSGSLSFWQGSQTEYDALGSYDSNTVYFVT